MCEILTRTQRTDNAVLNLLNGTKKFHERSSLAYKRESNFQGLYPKLNPSIPSSLKQSSDSQHVHIEIGISRFMTCPGYCQLIATPGYRSSCLASWPLLWPQTLQMLQTPQCHPSGAGTTEDLPLNVRILLTASVAMLIGPR